MPLVTSRTRAELKESVGRALGVLGTGDGSLSAEDDSIIDEMVDNVFMMMSREGLINFDITDNSAIDIASYTPLRDIIAGNLTEDFELDPARTQILLVKKESAINDLKRMVFDGVYDNTISTEYF